MLVRESRGGVGRSVGVMARAGSAGGGSGGHCPGDGGSAIVGGHHQGVLLAVAAWVDYLETQVHPRPTLAAGAAPGVVHQRTHTTCSSRQVVCMISRKPHRAPGP